MFHTFVFTSFCLLNLSSVVFAADANSKEESLQPLKYNNPGLVVDLGVGLWAWPVPCDADGDGDLDLIVATPFPSHGLGIALNDRLNRAAR